jgi:hypothetical protein
MDRELLVCSIDRLFLVGLYVVRWVSIRRLLSRLTMIVLRGEMNEGRRVLGNPNGMVLLIHPLLGICTPLADCQLNQVIRCDDLQRDDSANLQ